MTNQTRKYRSAFLICPAIAYGFYLLLMVMALVRQHTEDTTISFAFLAYWGLWLFLVTFLLGLLGFVQQKKLKQPLLLINVAISLAMVISIFSIAVVLQKSNTARYACQDYVRCLFIPGYSSI